MKINKERMTLKIKEQLVQRGLEMTDEQINDSIDEIQEMHDSALPFIHPETKPLQHMCGSFMAGIMFALDNFKRRPMDMSLSTSDGGKNWETRELSDIEKDIIANLKVLHPMRDGAGSESF